MGLLKCLNWERRLVPALLFCLIACGSQAPKVHEASGKVMGTTWSLKFTVPPGKDAHQLEQGVAERLAEVNALMSNWESESDVSRFARHRGTEPMEISPHTARVLQCALDVATKTEGVFDPTLSPLIDLWGFGVDHKKAFPEQTAIDAALSRIGFHKLKLEGTRLSKTLPELTLNVSANAKGYSIDLAAEYLISQGVSRFMMEVGGEVRTGLAPGDDHVWRIGINDPANPYKALAHIVALRNKALATSGDYHNFFMENGIRYSHIINPRTGRPIPARVASVSIIADNCMLADAWATALMLQDPQDSIALVEEMDGVECLILTRGSDGSFPEVMSSGMAHYLLPTQITQ